MYPQLALSLHLPLPNRLDSLTLAVAKWFTSGMYIKIEHRLQTYIIKYILSQKLEKYIKLIKYKINLAKKIIKKFNDFLDKKKELTFRPYIYDKIDNDIESAEDKWFRHMNTKQIRYNELIFGFKYNICNFNPYFIIEYKFFCDNGYLLPRQQRTKENYYTLISPEDFEILINTPLKNKNNTFLDFYNQELEISINHTIAVCIVYDLYKEWCKYYNKKCSSLNGLKEILKLNNFEIKKNFLVGVKIREYEED